MGKKTPTPSEFFRARQAPVMWYHSAQRLRAAAETIITNQQPQERPYFQAVDDAGTEAAWRAELAPDGTASVEIACEPPNYLPAQLLYAFAMENAFKGLILIQNPEWVGSEKLDKRIKSHDLIALAEHAAFSLAVQEISVLKSLSQIAEWVGRYPVAAALKDYERTGNPHPIALVPDALLDFGSQHPMVRYCFDRALAHIRELLPTEPKRFGVVVAFSPTRPRSGIGAETY
jgi:hypothetical protein